MTVGNAVNVEELYRNHGTAVQWIVRRIVKDPQDAEDISQAAFERLMSLRGGTTKVHNERAFLFATATNLALNHIRHRKTVRMNAAAVAHHDRVIIRGVGAAPETEGHTSDKMEALNTVIQSLPPKCKTAFVLCKLKGLTYKQAAGQMGVSEHMIRNMFNAEWRCAPQELTKTQKSVLMSDLKRGVK